MTIKDTNAGSHMTGMDYAHAYISDDFCENDFSV